MGNKKRLKEKRKLIIWVAVAFFYIPIAYVLKYWYSKKSSVQKCLRFFFGSQAILLSIVNLLLHLCCPWTGLMLSLSAEILITKNIRFFFSVQNWMNFLFLTVVSCKYPFFLSDGTVSFLFSVNLANCHMKLNTRKMRK